MCYALELRLKQLQEYLEKYKEQFPGLKPDGGTGPVLADAYFVSGFTHPFLPLIRHDGVGMSAWGLIPGWTKDAAAATEIRSRTLNAMGETVFEKPAFRDSVLTQRGVLGVTGFYEWREFNRNRYPYLIRPASGTLFSFGCIYGSWTDRTTGEHMHTFSIVTTPANPLMEKIHNTKKRMPLILQHTDVPHWVNPELPKGDVEALIRPFDEAAMTAHTITREAGNARFNRNVPEIGLPVHYPELSETQQSLF